MKMPLVLPQDAHELADYAVDWKADPIDSNPPQVKLTASLRPDLPGLNVPIPGITATTLAIQMDARVAIALYERLGDLGRSMGWLPQKEGERQA